MCLRWETLGTRSIAVLGWGEGERVPIVYTSKQWAPWRSLEPLEHQSAPALSGESSVVAMGRRMRLGCARSHLHNTQTRHLGG